jgi:hypothetical protein
MHEKPSYPFVSGVSSGMNNHWAINIELISSWHNQDAHFESNFGSSINYFALSTMSMV